MPNHFLAFDLGAESGRALLGILDGNRLTLEEKHRFPNPNGVMNGQLQWNLLQQWEELKTGLKNTVASHKHIDGIGVDTWGVDFGFLSSANELLGNPICYRDPRTDGMMEKTFAKLSKQEIFNVTGIQFMQFNSLFQLMAMREKKSAVLDHADTMLFVPDLFNFLFTGEKKAELSIASTSQMIDPRTRSWAKPMLEKLGLPTKILPQLVPSGTIIGKLQKSVQDECKAPAIPVIAPGCHDTASAVAAVPASGGSWCYISSGTWSLMGVELPEPIINEKSLEYSYTNELGVGNTVRFLKNIMGLWLVQECRRQWLREGQELNYVELTRLAKESTPFASIINPDHGPFLTPGNMPGKIEDFCRRSGQAPPATIGSYVRTCLEGLALAYRKTVEGLEVILGKKIDVIHIVGGGTQNELLNQMTADACGRKVITGPIEATAIGNILTQAIAVGVVKDLAHAREIVRNSFPVKTYDPTNRSTWDSAYDRYKALKV